MLPSWRPEPAEEALREKLYAAERRIKVIRIAVIALNTLTYFTLFDRSHSINWLAVLVIGVAWAYSVPVAVFEPYRRMHFLMGSMFTAVNDGLLITFWLVATGGYNSPYYVLWYVAIASIAFRYDYGRTILAALIDSGGYIVMLATMGQLTGDPAGVVLRVGYIFLVGAIGGEAAREGYNQVRSHLQLRDRMRMVEEAESKFRAVAENARDAIISVDEKGTIVYFNPHAEELLGYAAAEALGRRMEDMLGPSFRELWRALQMRALSGQLPEEPVQLAGLRRDGEEMPLEISLAPWKTNAGQFLTGIARDVTERKRAEAKLEYLSLHDALTELPNRVLMRDRLQNAMSGSTRDGSRVAFLLLDLDYFKDVNDTFGHGCGDSLLQGVAGRLTGRVRDADTVARLAGDEFALVLTGLRRRDDATAVARKILQSLEKPFQIEGQSLAISASIGIVVAPDDGHDVDTLLRRADVALYAAKAHRNGFALYEMQQDETSTERLRLTADLRRALDGGELGLEYQPEVNYGAAGGVEVEALVRWCHPIYGPLQPGRFIPLAERSGMINDVTDWVVDTAAGQARKWLDAGREIPVAVNVSARTLHDPELRDRIERTLRRWDLPPRLLKLEITESTVMAHSGRARETLERLSSLGIALIVDDFGTGYSSFAYLKHLPVAELKVDRTLIRDMLVDEKDAAIVRSIVDLAHNLGMRVVAEGIEDEAVWRQLGDLGCDRGQGYYLGRSMAAEQLDAWLATSSWANPTQAADGDRRQPRLELASAP
jgi:diguanylate cyclase (GGDEF)-like protein/PAS domain S-box-containing protein